MTTNIHHAIRWTLSWKPIRGFRSTVVNLGWLFAICSMQIWNTETPWAARMIVDTGQSTITGDRQAFRFMQSDIRDLAMAIVVLSLRGCVAFCLSTRHGRDVT